MTTQTWPWAGSHPSKGWPWLPNVSNFATLANGGLPCLGTGLGSKPEKPPSGAKDEGPEPGI